jgi:hypothetical protein
MDSDALFHLENIKLTNVHDTSCFHATNSAYSVNCSLNQMLSFYGLDENMARDKSVYQRNPNFWADRPLTSTMIEWASSDVDELLVVATKQVADLDERGCGNLLQEAQETSKRYAEMVRGMKLERNIECHIPIGLFIGRRGANIRSVEERTNTQIYQDREAGQDKFLIFYPNLSALERAKSCMGH